MSQGADRELFDSPIPQWDHEAIVGALVEHYGLRGELTPLPGERDQNLLLSSGEGCFAVKIANPADSAETLDLQQAALEHIHNVGAAVTVPAVRRTLDGRRVLEVDHEGSTYPVRVQTYLSGIPLRESTPIAPGEVGAIVAAMQSALHGFFHRSAGRFFLWDMRRTEHMSDMVQAIPDQGIRDLVAAVLRRAGTDAVPLLSGLPAQVIHNDLNPDNVLIDASGAPAVIDFGDMLHGPRVMDLAVAAAYAIYADDDPAATLGEVARGYLSTATLSPVELSLLADLVSVRLCQTIMIGSWRVTRHPHNDEYIGGDVAAASGALTALESMDRDVVRSTLFMRAGMPAKKAPDSGAPLLARRRGSMPEGLRLSYDEPLHLVEADGVWVTASDGRRYLDAYNNVVQVGHGHPLIAATLAEQTRRLNTNTRYLTDEVVSYAERITALLPDGLDVCYFTTSGSEANDLAWRIATTLTGNEGAVITEHAYHGSTTAIMALSPEELPAGGVGEWVETIPPPPHDGTGARQAVERLRSRGHAPAGLILDTVLSSDGIFDVPAGYLDESVAAVRNAGGLFIADEVQAGLGRVGSRFWGFAAGHAVPDIVTLGKPIGNGHPIGAVVLSRDAARRFSERGYFFSTFGGNTVSAAVGAAVLDITNDLDLPGRAERVGSYLRTGLRAIADTTDHLGEVRGPGLFVGVEASSNAVAKSVVEAMRNQGVLIGRTGPGHDVLKIRPPLMFEEQQADVLIEALATVIA